MSVDRRLGQNETLLEYIDRVIVGVGRPKSHDPFVLHGPMFFEPSFVFSPYTLQHHHEKLWEPFHIPVF